MGFLKKKADDGEDSSRLALFGNRSKSKSPAPPPSSNPYAAVNQPPDAYTQAKMNAGVIPNNRPPPQQQGQLQNQGSYTQQPAPPSGPQQGYANRNPYASAQSGNSGYGNQPPYGQSQSQPSSNGYGPNRYGNDKGYGAAPQGGNPYASSGQSPGPSRGGGYGGLGSTNMNDTQPDPSRDALFGGAKERVEQRQQNQPPGYEYKNPGADANTERSYGAYGDRQLTAEEEEEEDIRAHKDDIRTTKQATRSAVQNINRMIFEADESGQNTLARMGDQGERLLKTEANLDHGNRAIKDSEVTTDKLKSLNRSMWAVHVANPFTANKRAAEADERAMQRNQDERAVREANRQNLYKQGQQMQQNFNNINNTSGSTLPQRSLAERSKYQFEADSEDDELENNIEDGLDQMSLGIGRLNKLARAIGDEADAQNQQVLRVQEKVLLFTLPNAAPSLTLLQSDRLDDRFTVQTERLKRIK